MPDLALDTTTVANRLASAPRGSHPPHLREWNVTESGEPVDQLQHLVLTRLAELGEPGSPMSGRAAARRSRGGISYDTIAQIASGKHSGRITDRIAEGLAAALDVPVSRVYDAAGAPRPQGRWLPPERFDRLTIEQRRLLEDMGAALLDADAKGYERGRRDPR